MATFRTSLTPTPAKDKGIPYTWFTYLLDNTLALKQGDQSFDYLIGSQANINDTGTLNNHNPTAMDLAWSGASQLTVTGIVPRATGDIRIYRNVTASQALILSHQNTSSTTTNRLQLPAAAQVIGPNGSVGLKYDGTVQRWFMLFCNPGKPIDVAYNAILFNAVGGGTWSFPSGAANLLTYSYSQHGAWMDIDFLAQSTTTSGTVNSLTVPIPAGFMASKNQVLAMADCKSNGTFVVGTLFAAVSTGLISVLRQDRANWPAGAANNDVGFTVRVHLA